MRERDGAVSGMGGQAVSDQPNYRLVRQLQYRKMRRRRRQLLVGLLAIAAGWLLVWFTRQPGWVLITIWPTLSLIHLANRYVSARHRWLEVGPK
jgi:hypothetical protein